MSRSTVFLSLLTKLHKAFEKEGIKVLETAGSKDGLCAHLEYDGQVYGLFLVEKAALHEAFEEFRKHADKITTSQTQN